MVAIRALKLASAILVITAPLTVLAAPALADTPAAAATLEIASNSARAEDPTPSPASSDQSEAAKQAAEKAREAAKQVAEKAREAAKQAAKDAKANKTDGQLQLPPLIIRPATPNDKVSQDTEGAGTGSGTSGTGSSGSGASGTGASGTGSGSAGSNNASSTTAPPTSADPNAVTSGAGTGGKKFYKKPATTQITPLTQTGLQPQTLSSQSGDASGATDAGGDNQITYVVSPLSNGSNSSTSSSDSKFVKAADPTANDPIRLVSAATLKTPADQFFEIAGFGILVLVAGVALMLSWGVYRGIRSRRSEGFDFEYRS